MKNLLSVGIGAVLLAMTLTASSADVRFITVASTTSTQSSGLFDELLPQFTKQTGIEVRVVAVGTGQAIRLAERGDADVLFVHHRASEDQFVADGFGLERFDVMANDFIVIGPEKTEVAEGSEDDASQAFAEIAAKQQLFFSRGDDSGTNKKERFVWAQAGVDPNTDSGGWYRETGAGMGATLNTAVASGGVTLTDRATWINYQNKADYRVLVEGDEALYNPYGVILVNAEKFPHIKTEDGQAFVDWLVSEQGQAAIAGYQINGKQLFFPTAK